MLAGDFSNGAYDTEPYQAFITVYWFDVFDSPHRVGEPKLVKDVSMNAAKRKGHQRATALGLKPEGKWQHASENYATRSYRTTHDARRLVVVERS